MENETMEVSIIENSLEILKSGGVILQANQERASKAVAVGNSILQAIEANGGRLTKELDERCKKYLSNCSSAVSEMKEERRAVTQIMDQLKKFYTEAENQLDVKKDGTPAASIQKHRNAYAQQLHEEAEERNRQAEIKAQKEKEAIDIKSSCDSRLMTFFNDYLLSRKTLYQETFNKITLDDFSEKSQNLRYWEPAYPLGHFETFKHGLYGKHHNTQEVEELIQPVLTSRLENFKKIFHKEMSDHLDQLVALLPSKKSELEAAAEVERKRLELERQQQEAEAKRKEELAAAAAADRKALEEKQVKEREVEEQRRKEAEAEQNRLNEERMKREAEENERLEREAAEQKKQDELQIEMNKNVEQTMVLFNQEADIAVDTPTPESRKRYEIVVSHPAGYVQIFQFWFEREGKNLSIEKIGNTKMDQMKAFCEKMAFKSDEKIESKFLTYKDVFSAVNRKAKA